MVTRIRPQMSSPVKEQAVVDIRGTAEAHRDITGDLLAIHGLVKIL